MQGTRRSRPLDYELDKHMLLGKTYSKTTVLQKLRYRFLYLRKRLTALKQTLKISPILFYGYKDPNGYLILTDGKEDKPTVYLYKLEQPMELKVTAEKAAIRKEPLYDSECSLNSARIKE